MNTQFKISHDELDRLWDRNNDYHLTSIEGICGAFRCPLDKKVTQVITQVGVDRFGVQVGACFYCLDKRLGQGTSFSTTIKVDFDDQSGRHEILIALDGLIKLVNSIPSSLREEEKEALRKIIDLPSVQDLLKKLEKPYQCKECLGVRKIEWWNDEEMPNLNELRAQKIFAVHCFCCGVLMAIQKGEGCSMINCQSAFGGCGLQASKICVYCVDGAIPKNEDGSSYQHISADCSQKRRDGEKGLIDIPPIRYCDCDNNAPKI